MAGVLVAVPVAMCIYPVAMMLRGSLSTGRLASLGPLTLQTYAAVYSSPETYQVLGTTAVYAVSLRRRDGEPAQLSAASKDPETSRRR